MIRSLKNRLKWLVLLVVLAIGWISVGSLVMFHQEHVYHKHVDLQAYLFIAPKHKDKPVYSVRQFSVPGSFQLATEQCDQLLEGLLSGVKGLACFLLVNDVPVLDPFFGTPHSLRAPPVC